MFQYVKSLNHFYLKHPELYELDHDTYGFEWIDPHNIEQSVIAFIRRSKDKELIIICNFTPVVYYDYKIGVPKPGTYKEIFNSDAKNLVVLVKQMMITIFNSKKWHGFSQHIKIKVPPLAISIFQKLDKTEEEIFERVCRNAISWW